MTDIRVCADTYMPSDYSTVHNHYLSVSVARQLILTLESYGIDPFRPVLIQFVTPTILSAKGLDKDTNVD